MVHHAQLDLADDVAGPDIPIRRRRDGQQVAAGADQAGAATRERFQAEAAFHARVGAVQVRGIKVLAEERRFAHRGGRVEDRELQFLFRFPDGDQLGHVARAEAADTGGADAAVADDVGLQRVSHAEHEERLGRLRQVADVLELGPDLSRRGVDDDFGGNDVLERGGGRQRFARRADNDQQPGGRLDLIGRTSGQGGQPVAEHGSDDAEEADGEGGHQHAHDAFHRGEAEDRQDGREREESGADALRHRAAGPGAEEAGESGGHERQDDEQGQAQVLVLAREELAFSQRREPKDHDPAQQGWNHQLTGQAIGSARGASLVIRGRSHPEHDAQAEDRDAAQQRPERREIGAQTQRAAVGQPTRQEEGEHRKGDDDEIVSAIGWGDGDVAAHDL